MTSKLCCTLYNNERRGEKENEKEKEIKKKKIMPYVCGVNENAGEK